MIDTKLLIEKAFEAQKFCYTPYSKFNVGEQLSSKQFLRVKTNLALLQL